MKKRPSLPVPGCQRSISWRRQSSWKVFLCVILFHPFRFRSILRRLPVEEVLSDQVSTTGQACWPHRKAYQIEGDGPCGSVPYG